MCMKSLNSYSNEKFSFLCPLPFIKTYDFCPSNPQRPQPHKSNYPLQLVMSKTQESKKYY